MPECVSLIPSRARVYKLTDPDPQQRRQPICLVGTSKTIPVEAIQQGHTPTPPGPRTLPTSYGYQRYIHILRTLCRHSPLTTWSSSPGKGKAVAETPSPSPSSSTEALELLYPEGRRSRHRTAESQLTSPFFRFCSLRLLDETEVGPSNTYPESVSASHPQVAEPAPFSGKPSPSPVLASERPPPTQGQDGRPRSAVPQPNPGWQADEEEQEQEPADDNDVYDYVKGAPTHYMVVDALRQFTTLTNTIPGMEARIAEGRCLLRRAETQLDKATTDARELAVTREYLETFLLAKMKKKQELWDGTGKMEKKTRKVRMEWLHAERRAAKEMRWREMNAMHRKHGIQEESFSEFAYVRGSCRGDQLVH